jgi:hypothetical protein
MNCRNATQLGSPVFRRMRASAAPRIWLNGPTSNCALCLAAISLNMCSGQRIKVGALIVGFNLPFDLSRIAIQSSNAEGRYRGGFSLTIWDHEDKATGKRRPSGLYRPRIRIKHLDKKRSFIGFGSPKHDSNENGGAFERRFIDTKTLAFALTNISHSLGSACRAFGVEHGKQEVEEHGRITETYIEYNCRDVLATQELFEKLLIEFDRHPIELDPCIAFSPASMAKANLRAMKLTPAYEQFPNVSPQVLGQMMTAYYGGRAECRIRNTVVPVIYCDFLSMYPTVNSLMRLWQLITAECLEVVDATAEVQRLLDDLTLDSCFDPAVWQNFVFFAQVRPDGDLLPVRAQYSETGNAYNIGVNPLTSDTALVYAGPDLCASTLLSGKAPKVLKAYRLVPRGLQNRLTPVRLRGEVQIDPATQDFFKSVIEERKRVKNRPCISPDERGRLDAFLKVLANSGSYGIFAEMNREELPAKQREAVTVYGLDEPFAAQTAAPEEPGAFCFPPVAALIPSAARLMLAVLERCVMDAGGSYAFCDTDSMAIAATASGGLVPCDGGSYPGPAIKALSRAEVELIVSRFVALNPYDREAVPGSILKIEDENFGENGRVRQLYAYAISAKRYALFNVEAEGSVVIRKCSEHGLGHLLNPTNPEDESRNWTEQLWRFIVCRALGRPAEPPVWLYRPAISRTTASSPEIVRRLNQAAKRQPYARRIKPFNFLLIAHVAPLGHPHGVDRAKFQLIAPYTPDASRWLSTPWIDRYSGRTFNITTAQNSDPRLARVMSYGDVLAEYETHPEPKSAAADGTLCSRTTRGLLQRRPVYATSIVYIGKESNRLEEVEEGLIHSWADVQEVYQDPKRDSWLTYVVPVLKKIVRRELARAGLSDSQIKRLRNGHCRPSPKTRLILTRTAGDYARESLGPRAPADGIAACAAYVAQQRFKTISRRPLSHTRGIS